MTTSILVTKLFVPPTRAELVHRAGLIERLNNGLNRKMTLLSAPAGFGKTTLVSHWVENLRDNNEIDGRPIKVAWLSVDIDDNDPVRFLTYFITALNHMDGITTDLCQGALKMLQSAQPSSPNTVLICLINELAAIPEKIIFVLDDFHLINEKSIHQALVFLLENLPHQLHLVIATRQDPSLSLGRLRARDQMNELRAADLRFTSSEAADFLNQVMGLNLSSEDIAELETRTEGWIAGLQLAALSMRGHGDRASFIKSFTGGHRLVLDFLIEEVLGQQPEGVQNFLLQTAILDRMTGALCDALTGQGNGQKTLEMLDHANLFIVPLDNERRWYRYHRLFADLLRQRLRQSSHASSKDGGGSVTELHKRASIWFENNELEVEAFHHAAAANDVERAERLIEGGGIPLHLRGVVTTILGWLAKLPKTVLDARPSLWVIYAKLSLNTGQTTGVEEKLQAAEAALQGTDPDDKHRDLIGQIAASRAILALTRYQAETIIIQARRALDYLNSDNLLRIRVMWTLGFAYQIQGERALARQVYTEAKAISQEAGNIYYTILATSGLGDIQVLENQLYQAAEIYWHVLQLHGDDPQPIASDDHLNLARIYYEWNDLDAAEQHGQQSLELARQFDRVIDRFIISEVFLARLKLTRGDVTGAAAMLAQTEHSARQKNFNQRMPEIAAVQVLVLLRKGNVAAAADLARRYDLPLSQARISLAQGDPSAALAVLEPWRQQVEAKGWVDEQLKVMVLRAVALYAHGENERAVNLIDDALALAESGGFIRIFVDEGPPMAQLLYEALSRDIAPEYVQRLLAAFPVTNTEKSLSEQTKIDQSELIEPLSDREIEVLQFIAKGLTNQVIATRLFLSIHTIKTHTRNIYSKLGVNNRTQAVDRARSFGILPPT